AICNPPSLLPRFLVQGVLALLAAELLALQPVRPAGLLLGAVVAGAAHGALEPDVFAHGSHPDNSSTKDTKGHEDKSKSRPTFPAPLTRPGSASCPFVSFVDNPTLLQDLRHHARADGAAALADGEAQALVHGDGRVLDQLDGHLDV